MGSVMSAKERMATSEKGSSNNKMGISWEKKYAEFKRCVEMPKKGTPLHTWQMHQLSNTHDGSLNAKIRKEIEENEGSTVWSDWRVKLCGCVEQKNRAKIGNTWEEKYGEFKTCVGMPERGTQQHNWAGSLNAKIRKERAECRE